MFSQTLWRQQLVGLIKPADGSYENSVNNNEAFSASQIMPLLPVSIHLMPLQFRRFHSIKEDGVDKGLSPWKNVLPFPLKL